MPSTTRRLVQPGGPNSACTMHGPVSSLNIPFHEATSRVTLAGVARQVVHVARAAIGQALRARLERGQALAPAARGRGRHMRLQPAPSRS